MSAQYKLIRCQINGRDVEQMVDVRASLTDILRNDFQLTSVKKGCEVGECGPAMSSLTGRASTPACTWLFGRTASPSALWRACWAPTGSCRTSSRRLLTRPPSSAGSVEILESGREYTDEELRKLLSGHLCRCTGYENILRAVKKTMYRRLGKEYR